MKKIIIIALSLLLIVPEGCKKYEDGPWISFRSKKNRLIGLWHVEEYKINNYDSTNLIKNRFLFQIGYLNRDYDTRRVLGIIDNEISDTSRSSLLGEWDFLDNDKKFSMKFLESINGSSYYYTKGTGPFGTFKVSKWYIKRFTFDDFWLETNYEENIYYLKLKKDESYVS